MRRSTRWIAIVLALFTAAIAIAPFALYLRFVPGELESAEAPDETRYPREALELMAREVGCDRIPQLEPTNVYAALFGFTRARPCAWGIAYLAEKPLLNSRPADQRRWHLAASLAGMIWITRHWSAEQALTAFLSAGHFGKGLASIDDAAQRYFAVPVVDLTRAELAQLVAIAKSPAIFDPWCNVERNREAANRLLERAPRSPIPSRLLPPPRDACARR